MSEKHGSRAETDLAIRRLLDRNSSLHNLHRGERCFIIAPGPSIERQDLRLLQGETCIAVGNFFAHPHFRIIHPRYYCIAPHNDPVTEGGWDEGHNAICGGSFPHRVPITEGGWDARMLELDSALQGMNDVSLMFGLSGMNRIVRKGAFAGKTSYYFDLSGSPDDLADRELDLARPVPEPRHVSIMALTLAIAMGFSRIYLIGCDHDRLLHMCQSIRSYPEEEHAAHGEQGKNREWESTDLEAECRSYISLWQQYKVLNRLAGARDCRIFNATDGGLLDVFPRVSLAEVLAKPEHPANAVPCPGRREGEYGFFGDLSAWSDALRFCEGYHAPQILERVKNATLKVLSGNAAYERDSVAFDKIQYEWIAPLVSWFRRIASEYGGRLRVIDFGGSLGSTYFALRPFLSEAREIRWSVIEQEHFVECGKKYIEDGTIHFYKDLKECTSGSDYDIFFSSSAFQYLENPHEVIEQIASYGFSYMIIDRTPFISGNRDRLTAQFVPPEIYPASYPAWFFSLSKFTDHFSSNYDLLEMFDGQDRVNIPSIFRGLVFKKKNRIDGPRVENDNSRDRNESEKKYHELAGHIHGAKTAAFKQSFLARGCTSQQELSCLESIRNANRILTDHSSSNKLTKVKNKPVYAIFEMSSNCVLNCTLCNTGGLKRHFPDVKRGSMSFDTFKTGMDKLLPEVESLLMYNWGEPFLNRDLFRCIRYASGHNVHTQLSTNMMLYNESMGRQLIESGLSKLIVSCDGMDQETYQKYRKGGNLEKVMAGVENLISQKRSLNVKHPLIEMQFIVFKFNEHQLHEYERYWTSKGADSVNFIQMSYMSKYGKDLARQLDFVPVNPAYQPHYPYGAVKKCDELYNQVTIDWNGDWYTCCFPSGMSEYRVGNIVSDDFWSTWNCDRYAYCRGLVRDQRPGGPCVETMCHDCVGIFPRADTRRYWSHPDAQPAGNPSGEISSFLSVIRPGGSLLEIGIDAGLGFEYLSKHVSGPFNYIGMDSNKALISKKRSTHPGAHYFHSAGSFLFFNTNQFDLVIVSVDQLNTHHSRELLGEICRVARNRLVLTENSKIDNKSREVMSRTLQLQGFRPSPVSSVSDIGGKSFYPFER